MTDTFLPVLCEINPEATGRLIGQGAAGMMAFAGLIKCLQIMRRPTTSTLCVASLACILCTWLLGIFLATVDKTPLLATIFALVYMLLVLASLVFGLVGLLDYRRQPNRYQQGKAQAIWGILISLIYLTIFAFAFSRSAWDQNSFANRSNAGANDSEMVSGEFEDLNFRFTSSGGGWVSMPVKAINPLASLAYLRRNPESWFLIIVEKIGVESGLSNEALATIAQTNLRASASNVKIGHYRHEEVGGAQGLRFEIDAEVAGQSMSYSFWVSDHNGYAYQLITFTRQGDRQALRRSAMKICEGFQLIEPGRIAHAPGILPVQKHRSEAWGYQVNLSNDPGWAYTPEDALELDIADFSAARMIQGHTVNLAVVPLALPAAMGPTDALLSQVAASQFGMEDRPKTMKQCVGVSGKGFEGSEISGLHSSRHGSFAYRMRMVLSNDCGYLVAAWWPPECKEASNWSKGVMGNVEFFPPRGIPSSPSKQRANAMGLLYNDLGINKYSKAEFEPAIKYFEMSLEHALDEVVVSNLVEAYFDNNQEESARTALEKHLGNFPESLALGNLKANLCLHQGESELAMNLLSDLFRNGYDDEDQLLKYLNLAVDSEQFDQAIETLEHVLRERPTAVAQRWYALMHSRNGQHEEAIRLMIKLTKEYPEDTDCQYALGDAYEMAERYNEAIEVCDELIKKHPRDTDLWFMKGRSELELGRYAQAADAFQKILVAQPGNEEAKRYMQHVSALLGQGDRSQISTLVEPVPLPTEISEMIQAAETQEAVADEEEHDRVDIYNVTGIAYQKGIQRRITFYRKFKVLTTAGADNYSTISWPFDPLTERPYVNQLAVFNQTGEQVAEGSPESYYVLDDSEADHASQDRRVHITVPNLKSGYSVAFAITIESLAAPEKFGFEKRFLAAGYPMRLGAVYFQGDLASVNHVAANLKSESVHPNLQVWSIERPTVFEWEAQQAPIDDFLSSVQIADQGTNWEEVGREYLERIAPKMQLDPQTRTQAEKITEGMAENSEKTAAIAKYIQAECTYKALEFGVRSQMPNSAARVLKNGYGDCKDHSVLLAQMLRSVGIEAHLALINSSEIISRELPSLEQFDHMIVYLPGGDQGDGAVFLDATEKHAVPRIPCTPGLEDKFSLVLDPQKPILVRTPSYGEKAGVVRVERVVEFQPQSDSEIIGLTVNESLFLNSYTSRGMRYYLQSFSSRERRKAIRDLFSKGDKIRIRKLTIDNLEQPTKDLVLNLEYSLPGAYHRVGNSALNPRLTGSIPALWEKYYLDQDFDDFRATPFQISMPLSVVSKTEFRLPEGLQLENAQKLTTQGSSGILQWTTRLNQHELGFAFESLIDRGVGKFPANAFPKYYEALQQAIGAAKSPIKLGQAKSALRN